MEPLRDITLPAPITPQFVLCVDCKYVRKNKEDYDYMCTNDTVAGISPVTGTTRTMMCWLGRSTGGKCGPTGKYYSPKNTSTLGQAPDTPTVDAPAS